ncbi:MAG: Na/Pi cotransporter family protein [Rhodobacterales bacterium]|nr:Na/Pi cotransporter family protein [Rhodobacterales bacterium]
MDAAVLDLAGGLGLFLFGMQALTGGLRQLAGRGVRRLLARFTTRPLAGVVTGLVTTAALQSSTAVMITIIGFVGAGLMGFSQAVGIIFGANIGSTATGWLVAVLGLKLALAPAAMLLLLPAALASAVAPGRWRTAGRALAGFCLLMVGLDLMRRGAAGVPDWIGPGLPGADGLAGRVVLVLLGAAVAALLQSSGAGVAAVLVLMSQGTVSFRQAAPLVIGMDIGTTATGMIAALGGSAAMRRTALAHVGYNLVTGLVALATVTLAAPLVRDLLAAGDPQTGLVLYHTLFNALGAAVMLPVLRPFARAIERLVPDPAGLSEPLDRRLLADPEAAMDAAQGALGRVWRVLAAAVAARLRRAGDTGQTAALDPALDDIADFLTRLRPPAAGRDDLRLRQAALMHLYDHLHRLARRGARERRLELLTGDPLLRRPALALAAALERGAGPARLDRLHRLIAARADRLRRSVLLREHAGLVAPTAVFDLTDALRWLEHSADHAARIAAYADRAAR